GAGQGETAAGGREQLGSTRNRHVSVGGALANTACWAYFCRCIEYASSAASVGIGTHADSRVSRIAVTFRIRNFSAALPLSWRPGISSTAMYSEHASNVGQPMRMLNAGAALQNRAAVLTVSPRAVYWRRSLLPMFPTTAGPVLIPIPQLTGGSPCATSSARSAGALAIRSYAQRNARRAWAGCTTGAFHSATTSSPTYLSMVPSHLRIRVLISSR